MELLGLVFCSTPALVLQTLFGQRYYPRPPYVSPASPPNSPASSASLWICGRQDSGGHQHSWRTRRLQYCTRHIRRLQKEEKNDCKFYKSNDENSNSPSLLQSAQVLFPGILINSEIRFEFTSAIRYHAVRSKTTLQLTGVQSATDC